MLKFLNRCIQNKLLEHIHGFQYRQKSIPVNVSTPLVSISNGPCLSITGECSGDEITVKLQTQVLNPNFLLLISDLFLRFDKRIILTCPAVNQNFQSIFLLQILGCFFSRTLISPSRWSKSPSDIIGYKSGVSYSLTHCKDRCTFLSRFF